MTVVLLGNTPAVSSRHGLPLRATVTAKLSMAAVLVVAGCVQYVVGRPGLGLVTVVFGLALVELALGDRSWTYGRSVHADAVRSRRARHRVRSR
jgi:small neutral amino acid transporter SnatA (MarC family)